MASVADIRTFIYDTAYDSWNRVRTMTYPDGEVVTYHYNAAGQIVRLSGNKQGRESVIVDRIGYDKDGHTVYTKLGNGTETTYTYDKQRERLQAMNLTADGRAVMENKYQYDAVDNILGIANAADPTQAASGNGGKAKLGGSFNHTYAYDDLNRLIRANGEAKGAKYEMTMTFGRMSEPLTKVQKVDSTKTAQSYDFTYKYEDSNHPTAPTQIGHEHYAYDANGNPTLVENDSLNTERRMYWDEDNRLMVLSDNGKTSRYTYNAAGERIIKSHGDLEGVYINGAPQGITFHETEDYTIYPAPIITVTKNRFTKHYFIGDKRVASKLGVGKFSNVYGISSNNVTAGQKDYAARMMQMEKQREEYYRKLGTPPGVPTMKGATADPDNTGYGYNTIIGELGDHSVPEGWVQRPKFNDKGDVPGPPIQWQKPEDPDNAQPGYGYVPADTAHHEDIFFYHSDHLGSTSYVTDAKANITQFDAYLPYGELLVDEHSSSEEMPYKFNGKEFDQETGLYYYGARYMNPKTSLWYGVDRFAEKYPQLSAYNICANNPMNTIDFHGDSITTVLITNGTAGIERIKYSYSAGENGEYGFRNSNGELYSGTDNFINSLTSALNELRTGGDVGNALVSELINSTNSVEIAQRKQNGADINGTYILWNPNLTTGGLNEYGTEYRPAYIGLGHEMAHIQDTWRGTIDQSTWVTVNGINIPNSEKYSTHIENQLRAEHNIPLRTHYGIDASSGQRKGLESTRIIWNRFSMFYNRKVKVNASFSVSTPFYY